MQNRFINPDEIRKAIDILKPGGQLFEVRILKGMAVLSGYFRDADTLINQLMGIDLNDANVYITLQELHEGCEARYQWESFINASNNKKIPTTSDNDVVKYSFIPIDLDPVRPAGISSSLAELERANELRIQIVEYMDAQGFKSRIQAFSGNGYHLLYKFDEPNSKEVVDYVQNVLKHLDELFSNKGCKVDTGNFNPSRILKLYGTLAQKGRSTEIRPHRMSKILEVKGFETA